MEASSAKKWKLGKDASSISVTDSQCELGRVSYPLWLTSVFICKIKKIELASLSGACSHLPIKMSRWNINLSVGIWLTH